MAVLLIHPPVSKPCEPPAGLARLAGALERQGVPVACVDANCEGLLSLLEGRPDGGDTWTKRAAAHLSRHLADLRGWKAYGGIDRYARAVADINRILSRIAAPTSLSLANYEDEAWSPLRSADLIRAAQDPERNVFFPYFQKRLETLMEERSFALVGFSLNYLSQALTTFAMIGYLRRMQAAAKIVLGGGLVTSWLSRPDWRNPFAGLVDELVAGPGETRLIALAGGEAGEGSAPPRYEHFQENAYLAPGRILPYSASSGCYWARCSFCPERAEGNRYVCQPPARILEELASLSAGSNPMLIHLLDNALSPALLTALAGNPVGAPWYGFARITPHLTDPDFCRALKRSGCVMLQLGLESGDQGVLDALHKGIDLADTRKVLRNLKQAGIAVYAYLLFGTPAENEASARATLAFVREQAEHLDYLNLAIFNLPLAGPDAGDLETYDFYAGDLSLYKGFVHPRGWNRDRVRQFLDKEFRRQPAVAAILRRDPPAFTSLHAPLFELARSRQSAHAKHGRPPGAILGRD